MFALPELHVTCYVDGHVVLQRIETLIGTYESIVLRESGQINVKSHQVFVAGILR